LGVRVHDFSEVVDRQALGGGRVVVLLFDEHQLGVQSCVGLLEVVEFQLVLFVGSSGMVHNLSELVDNSLLLVDDSSQSFDLLSISFILLSGFLLLDLSQSHVLLELDELIQEFAGLFSFISELVSEILVSLGLLLFLGNEILNFWVLVSLQLGNESFFGSFLFGLALLLEVLILLFLLLLLFVK
jgi:hypothetical protein